MGFFYNLILWHSSPYLNNIYSKTNPSCSALGLLAPLPTIDATLCTLLAIQTNSLSHLLVPLLQTTIYHTTIGTITFTAFSTT
eukprot:c9074_g1_i1 orf=286-534(-)